MGQSKRWSFVEATTQTVVSYVIGVAAQALLFPFYGWENFTLSANLQLVAIFSVLSLARGYVIRRAFNRVRDKS